MDVASAIRDRSAPVGLIPFIPAGYGGLEVTAATLKAVGQSGASVIEIGMPFSDPVADGPVIQTAFNDALDRGVRVDDVLAMVREVRPHVNVPLVAMLSFSITYRRGVETFVKQLKQAGFDGLILPDLPLPEADEVLAVTKAAGLKSILLVAPNTPPARRAEIVKRCDGFVYQMAVAGVTGERSTFAPDLLDTLKDVRRQASAPVAVGFGISQPEHVAALNGLADAAIVGSALVKLMAAKMDQGAETVARSAADLCRSLLGEEIPAGQN